MSITSDDSTDNLLSSFEDTDSNKFGKWFKDEDEVMKNSFYPEEEQVVEENPEYRSFRKYMKKEEKYNNDDTPFSKSEFNEINDMNINIYGYNFR